MSSAASGQSLASLPSDAGITDEQKESYKACGKDGSSSEECLDAAGIAL